MGIHLQEALFFLSKLFLVFYFLMAGTKNLVHFHKRIGLLKSKKFPFPTPSLAIAITLQIMGSLLVLFNFYPILGAIALIVFTLFSNFVICDFWKKEGLERLLTSFIFYANFAVIGGLLIVIANAVS